MPLTFSVCIPNFNYGRYLKETIQSVLDQDYPHFEVIVADNASTDDSVAVVESIHDPRIRLIRNRYNIGFSPNLDRATETATGDYMILLSSDDLMLPGALRRYAEVLESRGVDAQRTILTSAVDQIDSQGKLTGVSLRSEGSIAYEWISVAAAEQMKWEQLPIEPMSGHVALAQSLRKRETAASFLATCYPRVLYEAVEGYHNQSRIRPDALFLDKLLSENPTLIYVPQRLFAYRDHNQNQGSAEIASGALKYQVDTYMYTVEFPQPVLEKIGMTRRELQEIYVRRSVVEPALRILALGGWQRAFKIWAFGFGSYPGLMLRQWKAYALGGLLALGPIGKLIARVLYRRYNSAIRPNQPI